MSAPAPRKIPLEVIESVTSNFSHAKFIGEGFLGKVYGGKVSLSEGLIDVAVRRLDKSFHLQELAFEKEITILSRIKHPNIVSIVGYCYENNEMLIVNKRVARGSLRWHLSNPTLTWMKRLQISIGFVSALSHLHNGTGRNLSVIHHNVNSNTILLDENWEAKISGFEYSMTIPAGGLDLEYEKLGIGTYKSDVFSVGVVLFELLCRKEAFRSEDNNSFQASSAVFHYNKGNLHEFVDQDLYSQMDHLSFNIFSKIAYKCLTNKRAPPTMNEILGRLERALKVQQRHENNDHSTGTVDRRLPPDHLKLKLESLDHMRIPLADIVLATDNFSKGCIVSSGGYGSVYIAELDHVDKEYCTKKRSTVAIKCIIDIEDEIAEQGFYAEIEMLTSCQHSNIIPLLGFCDEGHKLILIYEYAPNGSLSDHLLKKNNIHNDSWARRVKICLDVAKGLKLLHTTEGDRQEIVHRDIKSANILLDENFEAMIGDFGLSVFRYVSKDTRYSSTIAGTPGYMDPQYCVDAKLKKESDVYSFGVVLFEILFGTVAYDTKYNNVGLALVAKQYFNKGTINEIVDPKIKEEITKTLLTSVKGPSQESLETFSNIANKCLAEAQGDRPTMENVVKELEKALYLQEKGMDIARISLEDIKYATENFSDENCIGRGAFGKVFKGQLQHANGQKIIAAKRLNTIHGQADRAFFLELEILLEFRHKDIIGLEGYCDEMGEKIIVYEYAPNTSLDYLLNDTSLTWKKRLEIGIDVASGLNFLHGVVLRREAVLHWDIKSSSILLSRDLKAKIAGFGLSLISPNNQDIDNVIEEDPAGTAGYIDPAYLKTHTISKAADIYSFGVVLFEILCGKLAIPTGVDVRDKQQHLGPLAKNFYEQNRLDDLVFEGIKEQIVPLSLLTFAEVAYNCLHDYRRERPTATEVVEQLKKALEFQEDCEMWEPKLPSDYREIIQQSETPEICYNEKKEVLYNMLHKGIRIQKGNVWFSLDRNNNRNEMISAKLFTYKNESSRKWRHHRNSR